MPETYRYQFLLHKFSADRFYFETVKRFYSAYTARFTGQLMTAQQMGDIATTLVMAERLMTNRLVHFGRVVVTQLFDDEPIGENTPSFTLVPSITPGIHTFGYLGLPGTRGATPPPAAQMVSVHVNREHGPRWSKWLPASCAPDDLYRVVGTPEQQRYAAWKVDGPGHSYAFPWFKSLLESLPNLDFSVDVDELGNITDVAPTDNQLVAGAASFFTKYQRWLNARPPAVIGLDNLFNTADQYAIAACRLYDDALGVTACFTGEVGPPQIALALDRAERLAGLWSGFAHLMGFRINTAQVIDGSTWWPPELEQLGAEPGSLVIRGERAPVLGLVRKLTQLHQGWLEEMAVLPDGTYRFRSDYTPELGFNAWKPNWLEHIWNRWDDINRWFFEVQDTINALHAHLRPNMDRPWRTRAQMRQVTQWASQQDAGHSYPYLEWMPFEWCFPRERGVWFERPAAPLPPNRVMIEIPKTTTQPVVWNGQYSSGYEADRINDGNPFNPRNYMNRRTRDLYDAYPKRGLFEGGLKGIYSNLNGIEND